MPVIIEIRKLQSIIIKIMLIKLNENPGYRGSNWENIHNLTEEGWSKTIFKPMFLFRLEVEENKQVLDEMDELRSNLLNYRYYEYDPDLDKSNELTCRTKELFEGILAVANQWGICTKAIINYALDIEEDNNIDVSDETSILQSIKDFGDNRVPLDIIIEDMGWDNTLSLKQKLGWILREMKIETTRSGNKGSFRYVNRNHNMRILKRLWKRYGVR